MSIQDEVEAAKASGLLIPFKSLVQWAATPRAFLMSQRLAAQISDGVGSPEAKRAARWSALEADIAHFVEGGFINWVLMKWLDPKKYENWNLKSVRPKPSLRVFGRFAEPDVFVGTHAIERKKLGGKWSIPWEMEKLECEDAWGRIFSSPPFSAPRYEDYITENAHPNVRLPP